MSDQENELSYRLPTKVKPHNYEIYLKPDIENFSCEGEEKISIEVIQSTDIVVLNSLDIEIKSVVYEDTSGNEFKAESIDLKPIDETAAIKFAKKLPVGNTGLLTIKFNCRIGKEDLKGFYATKYISTEGQEKYAAVTQFESIFARKCFPCWDEPAIKATFDLILTVPKDLTTISNMPVKSTIPVDDTTHTLVFERSPKMSTYLVAIVIGEYDYVEDYSADGVLVRVYTPKNKKEQGRFALHVATKVLPFFKDYFNIPYPLKKIDLVTIDNFSNGAMENWGLITYRETLLLFDPETTPTNRKQFIAQVIGHELAHQWFGNLVTMEWWTHLWLNEGYATFMENLSIANISPEYDVWSQFMNSFLRVLNMDSLKNTHAIEVDVTRASEISEIFDNISYCKGSSIIRMLHHYIGDNDFRKGMYLYLKKYSYANAETNNLWASLSEASQKPVCEIMSTWTRQAGFPLVTVEEKVSQNPSKRIFKFTQKKFFADGSSDPENILWKIPLTLSCSKDPTKLIYCDIFDTKTKEIVLENIPYDSWIKVNPGTFGFYRTMYSQDLFQLLSRGVATKSLSPLDRLGIIDDLSALSRAGFIPIHQTLQFLLSFRDESNYNVWSAILSSLSKIKALISHLEVQKANFMLFGRMLLRNVHARLGWDARPDESHLDLLLRILILNALVNLEDPMTLEEAKRRYYAHINKESLMPADLRGTVYKAVLSLQTPDAYNNLLKIYRESDKSIEKETILSSLGYLKDEEQLLDVLNFSLSDEVKSQNAVHVITSVAHSYVGRLLVWQFIKKNIKYLKDNFAGSFLLPRIIIEGTEDFASEEFAKEVDEFFKKNPVPQIERTVAQCIENIRLNELCLKNNIDGITTFLANIKAQMSL